MSENRRSALLALSTGTSLKHTSARREILSYKATRPSAARFIGFLRWNIREPRIVPANQLPDCKPNQKTSRRARPAAAAPDERGDCGVTDDAGAMGANPMAISGTMKTLAELANVLCRPTIAVRDAARRSCVHFGCEVACARNRAPLPSRGILSAMSSCRRLGWTRMRSAMRRLHDPAREPIPRCQVRLLIGHDRSVRPGHRDASVRDRIPATAEQIDDQNPLRGYAEVSHDTFLLMWTQLTPGAGCGLRSDVWTTGSTSAVLWSRAEIPADSLHALPPGRRCC